MITINREGMGKKLRELRGSRTIKEISDATGLAWSTICSYELGQRVPEDKNKVKLAKYYNVTIQELFFEDDITGSDTTYSNNNGG